MEKWKDILDYKGFYQVSSSGNVRSLTRKVFCISGECRTYKGKNIKQSLDTNGYMSLTLCKHCGGKRKHTKKLVHRLVAESFLFSPKNKKFVNHIDGNKTNNNYKNLEWCTHSENIKHAYKNSLSGSGENHYKAKLTNKEVKKIKDFLLKSKLTQKEIGKIFNTCQSNVSLIKRGINRKLG